MLTSENEVLKKKHICGEENRVAGKGFEGQ